jgi:acylphosphatase
MKAKKSAWTRLKAHTFRGLDSNLASELLMIAKRYIVRGRVQGVGFRWFVDHEARSLGLAGWVRNNIDGTVEALAMGSDQQHAAFAGKLRQGPRAARIDEVTELPAEPVDGLTTFRIEGAW